MERSVSSTRAGFVLVLAVAAAAGLGRPAGAASATRAWPGLTIGYRDLTSTHGYHAAVAQAADGLEPARSRRALRPGAEGCLFRADRLRPRTVSVWVRRKAPTGFQRFGSRVVVRSCPAVVRPLLVAHELGRVLGLGNDDPACSLMNSKGTSDGRTFALPAQCSRWSPPAWISSLVDPRAARRRPAALSVAGAPAERDPHVRHTAEDRLAPAGRSADALRTLVMRTSGRCPTRTDVAAGTASNDLRQSAATPGSIGRSTRRCPRPRDAIATACSTSATPAAQLPRRRSDLRRPRPGRRRRRP